MFDLDTLKADTRFIIFNNSDNTQYGDTDLIRNLNSWYKTVLTWVMQAEGDWQVNGDIVLGDIVAGQRDYSLPTDLFSLNNVFIMDSSGEYCKAKKTDVASLEVDPETYKPLLPEFDLYDNSLFIFTKDPTIVAQPEGIKLYYEANLTELTEDTTPNLSENVKRILSIGAAYDYAVSLNLSEKRAELKKIIFGDPTVKGDDGLKGDLMIYYASRGESKQIVMEFEQPNYI